MADHLGNVFTEFGNDFLTASMPVNQNTRQPLGILHGGASVALAETVGSAAAHLTLLPGFRCVGMEINANHLRCVKDGHIYATAKPLHLGQFTQVWDIRITTEDHQPVCISRLTMAIIKARS